jgi:uncharacterized protein YceH (UPF0502 family)
VRRIDRRPGQKEDRFEQLLGGSADRDGGSAPAPTEIAAPFQAPPPPPALPSPASENGGLADRVAALEAEVATLRSELEELRELYG